MSNPTNFEKLSKKVMELKKIEKYHNFKKESALEVPQINLDCSSKLEQIKTNIKNEIFNHSELSKLSIEVLSPIHTNQYLLKVVLKGYSVNFSNELLSIFSDIQNKFTSVKIQILSFRIMLYLIHVALK